MDRAFLLLLLVGACSSSSHFPPPPPFPEEVQSFAGPLDKVWSDDQCTIIGRPEISDNPLGCIDKCNRHPSCSAVNYQVIGGNLCMLRNCSFPVPEPAVRQYGFKGYHLYQGHHIAPLTGHHIDPLTGHHIAPLTGHHIAPLANPWTLSNPASIAECPSPWFRVGPQCFRTSGIGHNWSSARAYCKKQAPGGDLAQPIDIKALVDYMKSNGMGDSIHGDLYWLGGSDLETEGDWRWLNGAIIDRGWQKAANWDQSSFPDHYPNSIREDQPNNYRSGQGCLSIEIYHHVFSANSMGDFECDSRLHSLCERHRFRISHYSQTDTQTGT